MNIFLRSAQQLAPDLPRIPENSLQKEQSVHRRATTLEGLIAEDPIRKSSVDDDDKESDGIGNVSEAHRDSNLEHPVLVDNHTDVAEDEGWIIIPCKELSNDWNNAPNILRLRSLDRAFVFPGEQIHLLVCLSASNKDTEVLTPFKVAAVISKNNSNKKQQENSESEHIPANGQDGLDAKNEALDSTPEVNISETESILRIEDQKNQTKVLLESLENSHFFARIAESNEQLWSRRNFANPSSDNSQKYVSKSNLNAIIDKGNFDGRFSSGVARNSVKCYSLCNGDIVVLLQVNVAINNLDGPVLEVLQFEKHVSTKNASQNPDNLISSYDDPCHELLNWLLPLDRTLPTHSLSPSLNSPSLTGTTQRSISVSSSSQMFSFGHFRSYSMSALPQVSGSSSASTTPSYSKPSFDLEDYDRFSKEKVTNKDMGNRELLSFRGIPLEPERFSVHCGLNGIYLPRRRWRKKIEIIQPIEIHSFASEHSTEDLLCVQVKNVAPTHFPDIVVYLDSIAIIFEEASKEGLPLSLPIASVETGNGHSLPNLSLRRGEEHSFILKPVTTTGKSFKAHGEKRSIQSHQNLSASTYKVNDVKRVSPSANQYAILVSYRCNYTESKLFFKQTTSWQPRIARDLMISVLSEVSDQSVQSSDNVPQLPIQTLTLQASNLTSEDLTLTIHAPVASKSSSSVTSLTTPKGVNGQEKPTSTPMEIIDDSGKGSNSFSQHNVTASDISSSSDLGCTHLWLQSTIPLGCVPGGSSATVKLELLPLTDGIITLNTLGVAVKEKGVMYRPEQPLKIHATSSVSGII